MISMRTAMNGFWLFAAALLVGLGQAVAQAPYPNQPIKLIVSAQAGGAADVVARVIGEKVGAELGQRIVVDNRSGGGGVIGVQGAIQAKPDGYTIIEMFTGNVILPILQKGVYDWQRDLTTIMGIGSVPLVLAVNAKSGIVSLADLAAGSSATPGGVNFGSGGTATMSHIAFARLANDLKVKMTHVPYRGFAGAVQALLGDQVQFTLTSAGDVSEFVKSGQLRLIAVASEQRLPDFPDVPTFAELGIKDFYPATWYTYMAPARTPKDIIDRLRVAFSRAVEDPSVRERITKVGVNIKVRDSEQALRFMQDEAVRWSKVIEENQIKLEN